MNVKQIIEKHLKDGGFAGLRNSEYQCSCVIEDTCTCDWPWWYCEPCYPAPDLAEANDSVTLPDKSDTEKAKRESEI